MHPDIDIVFPLINRLGMGIINGTREEMESAINECHENNKGVYIMKVLAGGNFVSDYKESMDYITAFSNGRFARAMGMLSKSEVDMNVRCMNGEIISSELANTSIHNKRFVIMKQCTKCKSCVGACHSSAISVGEGDRAKIDESKCIKCGYCVVACPQFCIRMN
jgi:ferredoxin